MIWPVYTRGRRGRTGGGIVWVGSGGSPTHPKPKIVGADNVSVNEGSSFDPMAGVSATDWEGNTVPVTYTGTVDTSVPGVYTLNYTATDSQGKTARKRRTVTVVEVEAPHFTGITPINIVQGATLDLTDGVQAWLGVDEIEYTYTPTSIDECSVGVYTVTYTATGNGKTTTVDRTVTITQATDPVIHNNTPLTVYVNTDFDPLDGLTATDAHGNSIPVELDDDTYTLTRTVDGTDTTAVYIAGTVVPLRPLPLTDRQRFDGWYDNAGMTGTPITSVTMSADDQVWAKVTDLEAYASYDSSTKVFRVFVDEKDKYTNGQVVGTTTYYADWEDTLNQLPWTGESWIANATSVRIDNVIHPTRMQSFFSGMSAVTTMTGLWRIDTTNVSAFTYTFSGTTALAKPLDLSTWGNFEGEMNCDSMFTGSGVTSIDLSGWDSSKIFKMTGMFRQCTGLTTIYVSEGFDLTNLAAAFSGAAFTGCANLVGGQGTTYNSSYVQSQYARIDGGTSAPGYFTER